MTTEQRHVHDWRHGPLVAFDMTPGGEHTVDAVCVTCWEQAKLTWPTDAAPWTDADYAEHAEEVERRFGPTLDSMVLSEITDAGMRLWPKSAGE